MRAVLPSTLDSDKNRATAGIDMDLDRDPFTLELLELNRRLDQRQAEVNKKILDCKNSYRTRNIFLFLSLIFFFNTSLGLEENLLQQILDHCELIRCTVEFSFSVTPTPKSVQPFVWNNSKEEAHSSRYLQWLNDSVTLPEDVQVYHSSSLPFTSSSASTLRGTFDVAFVDKACVLDANDRTGIRVVVKLKKEIVNADSIQAIAELLAENILSQHPVVTVLTDLSDIWKFFWLAKGLVVSCTFFDLSKAITLLETIIREPGSTTSDTMLIHNAPYMKRCNFNDAIERTGEGGHALLQEVVDSLELVFQRPSLDMMSHDDVADMRDIFDTIEPEEVESQIEQVNRLVAQININ